jgi:hypothetical protein
MKKWQEIVKKVAPAIGTALGGPFAGAATAYLTEKLVGSDGGSSVSDVIMSASPEVLARIKEIDSEFEVRMKELDIDIYNIDYKDRNSARGLFSVTIWPQVTLSVVFVLGYFLTLYHLIAGDIEVDNNIAIILGVLTAAIPQILNFWFGSSSGSKQKTISMMK